MIAGYHDYELTAAAAQSRNTGMRKGLPKVGLAGWRRWLEPIGDDLPRLVEVNCRVLGPLILVWLPVLFLNDRYGETLRNMVPEWAYTLGGFIFMIGVMIPFIGMFMFPAALYAAIALRREFRLALPCWLFSAFGVSIVLAGFKGPLQLAGDQLGWPLLAAAGVAATWAGYGRRKSR